MTLALRMGRTLGELESTMPAREMLLWEEFDRHSPIGDVRGDYHAGQIVQAVFTAQGGKVSLSDAMIEWVGAADRVQAGYDDDSALEAAFAGFLG